MDLDAFLERPPAPLPAEPVALFVGVLERYKAVEVLAEAWRLAAPRLPGALLRLVGRGSLRDVAARLVARFPGRVSWVESLTTPEVAAAMDDATVLVLPSRSEGLPRIVVEAFCRGRAVVGARAGGIPDIVEDGVNGLLVPAEDSAALADALVRVLSDSALAAWLGESGRRTADAWLASPEDYARRVRELVEAVCAR
jgi:glycosyltransferase involved in cell wall biosynthesis